ncbi:MAG: RNA polymerase sigma factor [Dehalococcoidia bacterium]
MTEPPITPATPRDDGLPDDTAALVRRARAGEVAAFNALVVQHQDAAYSLALRFLGSQQAAEDATQEAFLRAYRGLGRFEGERFRPWLLSIVANAARDELRRQRRRPQRSLDAARDDPDRPTIDPPDPGPSPEATALRGELRGHLEAALRTLPEDWRMVVLLSDVHGLAYDEVASALGVPVGTVKSRLSRARGRLRDLLRAAREPAGAHDRLEDRR